MSDAPDAVPFPGSSAHDWDPWRHATAAQLLRLLKLLGVDAPERSAA